LYLDRDVTRFWLVLASSHKIFEEVTESFQKPLLNKNINLLV
jgi:hypothetical protein